MSSANIFFLYFFKFSGKSIYAVGALRVVWTGTASCKQREENKGRWAVVRGQCLLHRKSTMVSFTAAATPSWLSVSVTGQTGTRKLPPCSLQHKKHNFTVSQPNRRPRRWFLHFYFANCCIKMKELFVIWIVAQWNSEFLTPLRPSWRFTVPGWISVPLNDEDWKEKQP